MTEVKKEGNLGLHILEQTPMDKLFPINIILILGREVNTDFF